MKTRNLKTELRLKQKLITRDKGFPGNNEGRDGDFSIRNIPGRGLFFFYKWGTKWYACRMSLYTPKNSEKKESVIIPNKIPKVAGEIGYVNGKFKVKKSNEKIRQVLAVDEDGQTDADTIKISRSNTISTNNGTTNDLVLDNLTGDSSITLKTTAAGKDPYISFLKFTPGETFTTNGWVTGVDTSDSSFQWLYTSKSAGSEPTEDTTPSSSGEKLKLWHSGNMDLSGVFTCNGLEVGQSFKTDAYGNLERLSIDDDISRTPGDGLKVHLDAATITDTDTSGGGVAAMSNVVSIEGMTLSATESSVTTTDASSLYIQAAPANGSNNTITNAYSLRINRGTILLENNTIPTTIKCLNNQEINVAGTLTMDCGGDIVLDADGDQVTIKFGGAAGQIDFTNENSGDGVIQQKVDAKDLVVKQYDGNEVVRFTDGGDVKVTNVVYFAAETANTCDSSGGSASATIDWNVSQKQKLTITGTSNTINFTNPAGPCNLQLKIVQGDGSDTITAGHFAANVKWAGGAAPTLSTGNGAIDIVSFYFDGTSYHGVASLNFATV